MKYFNHVLLLTILTVCQHAMAQGPIGWASLNGGTTGGEGGTVVTATNRSEFITYAASPNRYIIQVQGTIELVLYEQVAVMGNKTIVGLGSDATLLYGGLRITGNNVIVRNLNIYGSYDGDWSGETHSTDAISVYGAKNVWIDHCWLHSSADGLLDVRSDGSNHIGDYVTISWTKFTDHNKVMLIGSSDNDTWDAGHLRTTIHHCWFDGTVDKGVHQRMPRVRYGDVHVLNNYYEKIGSYCMAARYESDIVAESNYFRNLSDPHIIDDVGLGNTDPGLASVNNIYEYTTGDQQTAPVDFSPGDHYAYTPDPAMEIPALVMNGAGPENPSGNRFPTAHDDRVEIMGHPSALLIQALENDEDPDGDDLRIAVILNAPKGNAGVRSNIILYNPAPGSTENDTILYQVVDTNGGIDTAEVVITYQTTSTGNALAEDAGLKVHPNPAGEKIWLELENAGSDNWEIQVFDSTGRIYNLPVEKLSPAGDHSRFQMDTSMLEKGMYFIAARKGNRLCSKKLIIQ